MVFFLKEYETKRPVVVVMVGALNVGSLVVSALEEQALLEGEELGFFRMGSTVVTLYPQGFRDFSKEGLGEVLMGQSAL